MRKFALLLVLLSGCSAYHVGDTVRPKIIGAPAATVIRVRAADIGLYKYTIAYTDRQGRIVTVDELSYELLEPVTEKP